jgi:Pro-kumamolisin, activation domain/Bacterial Ig-like domain (group 3)
MFRTTRGHMFAAFFVIVLLSLTLPASGQTSSPQTGVPSRITALIDNQVRTTIPKTTHPLAQAQFDRGPVDPGTAMDRMILVLGVSDSQEGELRTFLDSQQTKGSPDYHRWLTPEEFGQKFGPSPQDVQQVTNWLQQGGFRVGAVAKSGRWIEFSGTAAQVNQAFQTEMRNYQAAGRTHIANASDISIPAALAPVVRGVSLHDFFKKPLHVMHGKVHGVSNGTNPNATLVDSNNNVVHALAPGDFASIYDLNPLYTGGNNGSGQTIAIVARSDVDPHDVSDFQSLFFTSPPTTPNFIINGPDPGDVSGDDVEATLDTEWSGAVAPGATIDVVISAITATTDGVDLSYAYIVDNNLAQVMSISFGLCEQELGPPENQFLNGMAQQAAAQGISVFVSAGDDGAAACDDPNNPLATGPISVSGQASTPYVTAVGGTEFNEGVIGQADSVYWSATNSPTLVSVLGYIPEMVWNESCSAATCGAANANLFAGSGGVSTIYATPSYQSGGITGLPQAMRALPDVSLAAAGGHDGYLLCFQRICQAGPNQEFDIIGGTSASSPSMAGIMAIIDQKTNARQGLANYVLYSLAKAEVSTPGLAKCNSSSRTNPVTPALAACVFNDVTVGNNTVPGETGFTAVVGYDLSTGLGSVDANNLATAFASAAGAFQGTTTTLVASPVANPITINHGSPLNFNVGVTRAAGTQTPSGTVSLNASGGSLAGQVGVAATTISGSGATANGTFTGISNLPGGTAYNLTSHYPGDGVFGSSDSTALTVTVNPESSSTALTSIVGFNSTTGAPIVGTTITYGGFLDLRTIVSSATHTSPPDGFPTGNIQINDGAAILGELTLASGVPSAPGSQAEFINCATPLTAPGPGACLTVGAHPIFVTYIGDSSFNSSATANPAVTITVNKGTPTGAVTAPATAASGTPITVTAQVNALGPVAPTGTVQFFQGTTPVGSPANLTGIANAQITLTGSGNQTVNAQYSGDSTYNAAMLTPSTVMVTAPFNFTAASTSQTIPAGSTATYNLTLASVGSFTGQVSFTCTGAPGGSTCAVSPNPANLTTTAITVPLTVTVTNTANARLGPSPFGTWPFVFATALVGLLWGARKKPRKALLMVLALGLMIGVGSCGGGNPPQPVTKAPTLATLTVTGTNGSATNTINLSLTVTH